SPSMSPASARRATSSTNPSSSASSSKPRLVRMLLIVVMSFSPLRAPGAASGRVVLSVYGFRSVTQGGHVTFFALSQKLAEPREFSGPRWLGRPLALPDDPPLRNVGGTVTPPGNSPRASCTGPSSGGHSAIPAMLPTASGFPPDARRQSFRSLGHTRQGRRHPASTHT